MRIASILLLAVLFLTLIHAEKDCGIEKKTSGKIVGGDTTKDFYPWFALLHLPGDKSKVLCAGSLITSQHVVTAAHCFTSLKGDNNTAKYGVTLGIHDRCKNESTQQTFNITKVVIHPNFTKVSNERDIAIITLDHKTNYTPICLPGEDDKNVTDRVGQILGLGETEENNSTSMPCELQEAEVQIFTEEQCNQSKIPDSNAPNPRVICAGIKGGGVDSCQGDSGGPLQIIDHGAYVLAGIISYGFGCAKNGYPGIYTRTYKYRDFIKENIEE